MSAEPPAGRPHGGHLGTNEWRIEGAAKVRGEARYVADVRPAGMLHAAFARSPLPHARLLAVDAGAARAMPGVHAVLTGEDVRPSRLGRRLQDWPLLAWDRVRFVGDPVAVVAAETQAQAEAAADAITVEYEELPAVFDPDDAVAPDAPVLHPDAAEERYLGGERPAVVHPNIQGHVHHEHGDVDAAFATAARVFEDEYRIPRSIAGHLEPHGAVVSMEGERFRIVTTNKSPFRLRDHLEGSLDIPPEQLIVDAGTIGGDFGGKGFSLDEYVLTALARITRRPVRSVPRFVDDVRATNGRHAAVIRMRTGIDAAGRIVAHETRTVFDGGAYAAAKGNVGLVPGGSLHTLAGYAVPNARVDVLTVYTNQLPGGHVRAPGQPQNTFAAESHVDRIAREIGDDPLAFRRRNAIRAGEVDIMGRQWRRSSLPEVLDEVAGSTLWNRPLAADHGRGVALGTRTSPSGARDATVELGVLPSGAIELLTSIPDQGGGAHTMLQRVVAETLGLPLAAVTIRRGTTAETAVDLGVGGSRVTPVVGGAAAVAARELAARLEEAHPGLDLVGQIAAAATAGGLRVVTQWEHPNGVFATYACAVEVAVDRATGAVRVVDLAFAADVGRVINPLALRGQLVGAIVAGLGMAVMEELRIEDGVVTTANLGDYKVPTIADVPPIEILLVDGGDGGGPFGAKSAAELGNVPIPAAVANAVDDAVGRRIRELPISAERVFAALRREAVP